MAEWRLLYRAIVCLSCFHGVSEYLHFDGAGLKRLLVTERVARARYSHRLNVDNCLTYLAIWTFLPLLNALTTCTPHSPPILGFVKRGDGSRYESGPEIYQSLRWRQKLLVHGSHVRLSALSTVFQARLAPPTKLLISASLGWKHDIPPHFAL